MIEMKVKEEFYNYFITGTKRIEIRLNDEKRKQIKIGDKIKILKEPELKEFFIGDVIGLLYYDNFKDLFNDIDISLLCDKKYKKEEMLSILEKFYPIEEQKNNGVVGIRLNY